MVRPRKARFSFACRDAIMRVGGRTMSGPSDIRRHDLMLDDDGIERALESGFCGRLATVSADGAPYCTAMLYVRMSGEIWMHGTKEGGHLRRNLDHEPRVCLLIDAPGPVFDYGRFECDSSASYTSVMVFGSMRTIDAPDCKQHFFEALLAKYRRQGPARPANFFPRLGLITLYALTPERVSGKSIVLPSVEQQWPAVDRTKTSGVRAPS
jgi:nitroimidazol reductase NimA-like FMN-containing flavoprotein (pyridoxamine 5'-phosphate oxidase superfamily)